MLQQFIFPPEILLFHLQYPSPVCRRFSQIPKTFAFWPLAQGLIGPHEVPFPPRLAKPKVMLLRAGQLCTSITLQPLVGDIGFPPPRAALQMPVISGLPGVITDSPRKLSPHCTGPFTPCLLIPDHLLCRILGYASPIRGPEWGQGVFDDAQRSDAGQGHSLKDVSHPPARHQALGILDLQGLQLALAF